MKQSKLLGIGTLALAAVMMTACGGEVTNPGETTCNPACGENQECKDGQCVNKEQIPPAGECDPACGENQECKDGACVNKEQKPPAGECNPACNENQECKDGACVDKEITPPTVECQGEGQKLCGSICRDITKENDHCGDCDNPCQDGKTCVDSQCVYVCEGDNPDKCDDGCFNFNTDVKHCGNCTTQCGQDEACNGGKCGLSCNAGETQCGSACVNLQSDETNCGTCGNDCTKDGKICQGGECKMVCNSGELCGNDCIDLGSDANCGTCDSHPACDTSHDMHCSSSHVCQTACPDPNDPTQLIFTDLNSDKDHCGSCSGDGHACGENEFCSEGKCKSSCGDDEVDFEGKCYKKSDPVHCGIGSDRNSPDGGAVDCTALEGVVEATCEEGKCKITQCAANYAVCSADPSVCTDLTKPANCGSCDNACVDNNADADKTVCQVDNENLSNSKCKFECKAGMATCNNKCIDTMSDKNNCGWCGNQCEGDSTCSNGYCVFDSSLCGSDKMADIVVDSKSVKAYCIKNEADFLNVRNAIISGSAYYPEANTARAYILMDDLILEESSWEPIGNINKVFTDSYFIGNGKSISGKIKSSSSNSTGIFGYIENTLIKDLILDLDVENTNASVQNLGMLVNRAGRFSRIVHVDLKGKLKTVRLSICDGTKGAGGMIGALESSSVSNCSVDIEMDGGASCGTAGLSGSVRAGSTIDSSTVNFKLSHVSGTSVGGIGGHFYNSTVSNCSTSGLMKGTSGSHSHWGGVVGYNNSGGKIKNSSSSMDLEMQGTAENIGGLVGNSNASFEIYDSYATGNIKNCTKYCGGLVGLVDNNKIERSYATGKLTVPSASYSGGFAGRIYNSTLKGCYATGDVQNAWYTGGFAGVIYNTTAENIHSEGNASGSSSSGSIIGGIASEVNNSTLTNVYTLGSVWATGGSGGIANSVTNNSKISNCAAFGKVVNVSGRAGGLIATLGNSKVENCFAAGDVSGNDRVGSLIGHFDGTNTVENVYGTGTVQGTSNTGSFVGVTGTGTTMRNAYYWEENTQNPIASGTFATGSSYYAFKYKDSDAVLSNNEKRKLSDLLDGWVVKSCKLSSGPKGTVNLPIPKSISTEVCK